MKLITPLDADKRTDMEKLEAFAREAAQQLADYKALMEGIQNFMRRSGASPEQVQSVHPAQYCHDLLTEYAIQKLKE